MRGARRHSESGGFTFVELLVVAAIGMLTVTAATLTLRNLFRSDLRSAARRTAAAMRFAFDRATLTGTTVRLVFDLDKGEIWAEYTEERVSLEAKEPAEGEEQKKPAKKAAKKPRASSMPLLGLGLGGKKGAEGEEASGLGLDPKALTEDWEKDLEPPEKAPPSFERLKGAGSKRILLGSNVKIADVVTPRFTDPVEKGKAQVYFFPQGRAEPAIIHFTYKEEDFYSVTIHPLSGKAMVYPCYLQIPQDFGVTDSSKRRRSVGRDPCAAKGGI